MQPKGIMTLLLAVPAAAAAGCALDPTLPASLAAHAATQPLCAGFLNASAPPYSATGDGVTDDSSALQAALDDAYANRMAVLLPAGRTFLLARQLRAVQRTGLPADRQHGYQLIGTRGPMPPVLRVPDHTDPAAFPSIPGGGRPAVLFALNRSGIANDSPSHYSAMLRNVDIDLGDNPTLSGVSMSGAQLCSIEDVRISGKSFTAGVVGLPGSGGYTSNIHVTGGQFAVWQQEFRPNPSITGLVALSQSVAAVLVESSRGPLVLSGFIIRSSLASFKAGVIANRSKGADGSLALEDGLIALDGAACGAPAVSTSGPDIAIKDLYVRTNVAVVFSSPGHGVLLASTAASIKRIPAWWFSAASSIAYSKGANVSAEAAARGFPNLSLVAAPPSSPPDDPTISTQHSWTAEYAQSLLWSSDSSVMLDAVRDCGATPQWVNSTDDDGAAIAACLALAADHGQGVFIPRGEFLLWSPLVLKPGQQLTGAGKHCATLTMRHGAAFETAPLVRVEGGSSSGRSGSGDSSAQISVSISDLVLSIAQRGTILEANAPNTLIRDLRTTPCVPHCRGGHCSNPLCAQPAPGGAETATAPTAVGPSAAGVRFTGQASGRFYGLSLDHFDQYLVAGDALLSVNGAKAAAAADSTDSGGGVHLYQLSAEHLPTDYQVQVWDSSLGVHLHSFKFESAGFLAHPTWGPPGGGLFSCHASTRVSIFGGSGNYGIMNATMASDIIFAEDCPDMQLSSLVRKPQDGETPASSGALWIRTLASHGGARIEIDDSTPAVLAFSGGGGDDETTTTRL